MRFAFNPWYGVAGLGQGVLQGTMAGIEMSREKRLAKQEQVREALSLLQTGIKAGDPDTLQAMEPYLKSILGPQFQMPQIKTEAQRLEQQAQQMGPWLEKMGVPKEMVPWMIMGQKPPKAEEPHFMMTPQGPVRVTPGKYHNVPGTMLPQTYFDPQDPTKRVQMPPGSHPMPQQPAWQVPTTTTTESGLSPGEQKQFDTWQEQLNATQDPAERAAIQKKIEGAGGKVETVMGAPGRVWGKYPDKLVVIPPATRTRTTEKVPGLGGMPSQIRGKGKTPTGPLQFPRRVRVKGEVRTVNNQAEYEQAQQEAAQ